jgi:hypothetical protein
LWQILYLASPENYAARIQANNIDREEGKTLSSSIRHARPFS